MNITLKEFIRAAKLYYLKGRNFRGMNVWVWQVQKLRIPWNLFLWLNFHWELHEIHFRDGQIWNVAKGNNEKINDKALCVISSSHCFTYICYLLGLKPGSNLPKKYIYFVQWQPNKTDEKCFLVHLEISFRSQDN